MLKRRTEDRELENRRERRQGKAGKPGNSPFFQLDVKHEEKSK